MSFFPLICVHGIVADVVDVGEEHARYGVVHDVEFIESDQGAFVKTIHLMVKA